jgi:hypothetical protein
MRGTADDRRLSQIWRVRHRFQIRFLWLDKPMAVAYPRPQNPVEMVRQPMHLRQFVVTEDILGNAMLKGWAIASSGRRPVAEP